MMNPKESFEHAFSSEFTETLTSMGFKQDSKIKRGTYLVRENLGIHFYLNSKNLAPEVNLFLRTGGVGTKTQSEWIRASFGAVCLSLYIWAVYEELMADKGSTPPGLQKGGKHDFLFIGKPLRTEKSWIKSTRAHQNMFITLFCGRIQKKHLEEAINYAAWTSEVSGN
jgi:hypothetical protein